MNWICLKCGEFVNYIDSGKECPRCLTKRYERPIPQAPKTKEWN